MPHAFEFNKNEKHLPGMEIESLRRQIERLAKEIDVLRQHLKDSKKQPS